MDCNLKTGNFDATAANEMTEAAAARGATHLSAESQRGRVTDPNRLAIGHCQARCEAAPVLQIWQSGKANIRLEPQLNGAEWNGTRQVSSFGLTFWAQSLKTVDGVLLQFFRALRVAAYGRSRGE